VTSLPARIYGVIRSPRATFAGIIAGRGRGGGPGHGHTPAPPWAAVLIGSTVLTFVCSAGFLQTDVGRQALVDEWERTALAFGRDVGDAQYAGWEDTAANGTFTIGYAAVTALASGPVLALGLAAVLWFTLNRATGDRVPYVQVLAVVCFAGVILALRQAIATPLDYVRESLASPTTLVRFFGMLDEASPVARFLGVIDLFVIWWIVVLALGVSVLYRRPARRLTLIFAGAYVALALLAAAAMAVSGGTA
jgi:Yip1-like protein